MSTRRTASLDLATVEEGYRFDVHVGQAAYTLDTNDAAGFASPMQAVLAAVGGCTGMDVIGILRKMRQQVTGYTVEVIAERRDEHPRVYTAIEVVHRLRGRDLKPASVAEAIRLSDEKYCSVHAMLAPTVPMTSRFEIVDDAAGAAPHDSTGERA
jgi:putative redox protein